MSHEEEPAKGWVSAELRAEFPRLALRQLDVDASPGRSGPAVRRRLARLGDRFTGSKAIGLRLEPLPAAYRAFFRQVGIDPDQRRPPAEELAVRRIKEGGYLSRGRVQDALTLAVAETGVPTLVFDAAKLSGPLGLRLSAPGESLGEGGRSIARGQIVVADAERPQAVLFADQSEQAAVNRRTQRMALVSIGVEGVPPISLEEALWTAVEALSGR